MIFMIKMESIYHILENLKNDPNILFDNKINQEKLFIDYLILNNILEYNNRCCNGWFFQYQINGTQKTPDFRLLFIEDNISKLNIDVELKSSKKNRICLNDGWFTDDILYIISFIYKKEKKCLISFGVDIPTEKDKEIFNRISLCKRELNVKEQNNGDYLSIFHRFANTYNCDQFTQNFVVDRFNNSIKIIESRYKMTTINETNEKIYRSISLFSGGGGDTLGMKNANVDVVAFSENNKHAIKTHLENFPKSRLLTSSDGNTDIKSISNNDLQKYKETLGNIDIIFAGFPCQGFSQAGKKKINDPRNELVYECVRVVNIFQPTWFIGENVPGLLTTDGIDPNNSEQKKKVIHIIVDIFKSIGYSMTYKVINISEVGIPQLRKRLILIASKSEHELSNIWNNLCITKNINGGIRNFIEPTLKNAKELLLEQIPKEYIDSDFWIDTKEENIYGTPHPNLERLMSGKRNLSTKEKENNPNVKEITEVNGLISFGVRKSSYHGEVLHPDKPCKTIICTYATCPRLFIGLRNVNIGKYWLRCLNIEELAQIQSFPKDYKWNGNTGEIIKQIGNAVPPRLIEKIIYLLQFKE